MKKNLVASAPKKDSFSNISIIEKNY